MQVFIYKPSLMGQDERNEGVCCEGLDLKLRKDRRGCGVVIPTS